MIRAIVLSLVLVVGLATIVPLATEYAEAGSKRKYKKQRSKKKSYKRKKKVKRYSKRWWQNYRAKKKRRQALTRRKRNLRLRQIRLAKQNGELEKNAVAAETAKSEIKKPAVLPTGDKAPTNWTNASSTKSEVRFDVSNGSGSASISVVGPAVGEDSDRPRNWAIGGVSTTSLRRIVIDRMMQANGWVVNDYQKNVGGKTVYVVVAQSEGKNGVQSHLYYFTQADGRIYNVASSAPQSSFEQIAAESEKVVNSLQRGTQARNK